MKKFVFLLGILFALQTALLAQVTEQEVVFNATLAQTFNLNLLSGGTQDILFEDANDYNLGVTEPLANGIDPGFTEISIEATENWNLTIEFNDNFLPVAPPATLFIPLDNLGVYITEDGTHGLATGEVTYTATLASPDALTIAPLDLILLGANPNGGGVLENAFTLHWLMGTMQGNMNTESMFIQLANGDFTTGDYTTTATLTLVPE